MMQGQGTGGCALTVVAGPPTLDTGDGGPALEAQFQGLQQMAFDSAGNLYVADSLNSKIRRISADGIVSTIAGQGEPGFCGDGGPALDACLKTPHGVAVDGERNLFIADSGNHRIRKVSPSGVIETVAGNGDAGFNQAEGLALETNLGFPTSIAALSDGTLFILDSGNFDQLIYRLDRSGQIKTIAGYFRESGESPQRSISLPGLGTDLTLVRVSSIAVGTDGDVYFADGLKHRVFRVDSAGVASVVAGTGLDGRQVFSTPSGDRANEFHLSSPTGVAVDVDGTLYFSDSSREGQRLLKVKSDGALSVPGLNLGFGPNIAVRPGGEIFSSAGEQIRKAALPGPAQVVAGRLAAGFGGDEGPATEARLSSIAALAADSVAGGVFLADRGNHRVRRISADGQISTIAGTGVQGTDRTLAPKPATGARLNFPWALAVDSSGNLLVGEAFAIQKVGSDGSMQTVIGQGPSTQGDGGPASLGQTTSPFPIGVDAQGNIFFADRFTQSFGFRRIGAEDGVVTRNPMLVAGRLAQPSVLVTTPKEGLLAFAGTNLGRLSADSKFLELARLPEISGVYFAAMDAEHRLYYSDGFMLWRADALLREASAIRLPQIRGVLSISALALNGDSLFFGSGPRVFRLSNVIACPVSTVLPITN